jgi:hypothetical protein
MQIIYLKILSAAGIVPEHLLLVVFGLLTRVCWAPDQLRVCYPQLADNQ